MRHTTWLRRHLVLALALVWCGAALAMGGCKSDDDPVIKPKGAAGSAQSNVAGQASLMRLTITPMDGLIDEPVSVVVSGLAPGGSVTIRAETADALGQRFTAEAGFTANSKGQVDLDEAAAISGGYQGVDAMGLFWSMLPQGVAVPGAVQFAEVPLGPREVTLSASANDGRVASQTTLRRPILEDAKVSRVDVTEQGLVGVFFAPTSSAGPHPTLLVLGGSEGGLPESRAALMASHGYAALALAYFDLPGLPSQLASIPLEYFEKAFQWLEQQPTADMTRFGVMGSSKGGELALLLGSRYPARLSAVVAYVPSSVVWQGIPKGAAAVGSSWSYQGSDIPYVPILFTAEETDHFIGNEPQALAPAYNRGLENAAAVEAASIAVENIAGPVMLISAGDDAIWPSRVMSETVATRLADKAHPYGDIHLTYDGAGHLIVHPFLPTGLQQYGPSLLGGTPQATAKACIESWREVLDFLSVNLK